MNGETSVFEHFNSNSVEIPGNPALSASSVEPVGVDNTNLVTFLLDNPLALDCLLDRTKLSLINAKEASSFLKRRAEIELEYARSITKLALSSMKNTGNSDQNSYSESWSTLCKLHEKIGAIKFKFSEELVEISNELANLSKNTERSRKHLKDDAAKHYRALCDAEGHLEKAKCKYESNSEEWENAILQRDRVTDENAGVVPPPKPTGLTKSFSNPMNLWKQGASNNINKVVKIEEDARNKAAHSNQAYKSQLQKTNAIRKQYYHSQLPHILRSLLDSVQECDSKLKQFLVTYSQSAETYLMQEATTVCPLDQGETPEIPGLQVTTASINHVKDFDDYVLNYFSSNRSSKKQKGEKTDETYIPYTMSQEAISVINPKPFFGIPLDAVVQRDGGLIPLFLEQCIQEIEKPSNITNVGIYRLSGNAQMIQKLRTQIDKHLHKTPLSQMTSDVHNLAGLLKLYFRELPDSVFPRIMYHQLIEASKQEETVALIKIHEMINELPDSSYATLRALMKHLNNVQQCKQENRMGIQNLSIIFGPTLLDFPDVPSTTGDIKQQSKVVEIVLKNFDQIFEL